MIQLTPQMRLLVAVAPVDFRRGIDGLCRVCRELLQADPCSGAVFVFRNRNATSVKVLAYDGLGYWLCQKRLSEGRFRYWPDDRGKAQRELLAHELMVLLAAGNPEHTRAAPQWRQVRPAI
jgi:transposase